MFEIGQANILGSVRRLEAGGSAREAFRSAVCRGILRGLSYTVLVF
jgi:hypothetical protein